MARSMRWLILIWIESIRLMANFQEARYSRPTKRDFSPKACFATGYAGGQLASYGDRQTTRDKEDDKDDSTPPSPPSVPLGRCTVDCCAAYRT